MIELSNLGADTGLKKVLLYEQYSLEATGATITALPTGQPDTVNVVGKGAWSFETYFKTLTGTTPTITITFTKLMPYHNDTETVTGNVVQDADGKRYIKTESEASVALSTENQVGVVTASDFSSLQLTGLVLMEISVATGTHTSTLVVRALGA